MKTSLVLASALVAATFTLTACGNKEEGAKNKPMTAEPKAPPPAPAPTPPAPTPPPAAAKNLVEVATAAGSFKTLLTAVEAAGLTATLSGPGPFTVFAPTDAAFAKIPAKDLEALIADKAALTGVLTYHVVSGAVLAKDVTALTEATSLQGGKLAIDASNGVKINGATVVTADVVASNGVIHVIDSVLMPPK